MRRFFFVVLRVVVSVCRPRRFHDRNTHDETRSAFGRVFVMHAAVMQRHDVVNDRETETGAAVHAVIALTVGLAIGLGA